MSVSLQDLNSVFQTGAEVMNGASQVINATQTAWNNVQDVTRRSFGNNFGQSPYGAAQPTPEFPMTFVPYPGFWDDQYGK